MPNSTNLHTPYLMQYQFTKNITGISSCPSFASVSAKAVDVKYFQCFYLGRVCSNLLMKADSWNDLQAQWSNYLWLYSEYLRYFHETDVRWHFQRAEFSFWKQAADDSSSANQTNGLSNMNGQPATNVSPTTPADFTIKLHAVADIQWQKRLRLKLRKIGFGYMYSPQLAMFECESFHQSGHVPFRVQALPFAGFV